MPPMPIFFLPASRLIFRTGDDGARRPYDSSLHAKQQRLNCLIGDIRRYEGAAMARGRAGQMRMAEKPQAFPLTA